MIGEQLSRDLGDPLRVRLRLRSQLHQVLAELPTLRLRDLLDEQLINHVEEFPARLRRRRPAIRAMIVVRRERLSTVPTDGAALLDTTVSVDDAGLGEDVVVEILSLQMDVVIPHVGIDVPVDAVLDLLLRVPLPRHPRHRRMLEVMRVPRLLNPSLLEELSEPVVHSVRRDPAIIFRDTSVTIIVALEGVEERRVRLTGTRMRAAAEIALHRRLRIDQGVLFDRRVLQPDRGVVRRVRRLRPIQVDVTHAERARHRDARTRIREELHERDITLPIRGVDERRNIVLVEDVLRVDALIALLRTVHVEVFSPLTAQMREKHPEILLIGLPRMDAHRAVATPLGVGPHLAEERLHVAGVLEIDERFVAALGVLPERRTVVDERGELVVSAPVVEEGVDRFAVACVDVGILEALHFALVAPVMVRRVAGRHGASHRFDLDKGVLSIRTHNTLETNILWPPDTHRERLEETAAPSRDIEDVQQGNCIVIGSSGNQTPQNADSPGGAGEVAA